MSKINFMGHSIEAREDFKALKTKISEVKEGDL
jgi:hypothetical protein